MSDDDKQKPPPPPVRPFSLAEAVGRAAGDALRGATPVPGTRQTLLGIGHLLEGSLADAEGSLGRTILARLADDLPLLARHEGRPAAALAAFLDRVLADDGDLETLVRDTDARWGREYDERPRFEVAGRAPAPDDPYTLAGVRAALVRLRRGLDA
jgi:hypothetical protein